MLENKAEKILAKYLSIGSFLVGVFVLTSTNTDPVNVTKLLVLGGISMGILLLLLKYQLAYLYHNFKLILLIVAMLIISIINAVLFSDSPLSQNVYGTYGRSNGAMTYVFFAIVLIGGLTLRTKVHFDWQIKAVVAVGMVNVIYCAWVLLFGDFIGWENKYGKILGLFGNPDFISAFLGIFIGASLSLLKKQPVKTKCVLLLMSAVAFFEILKSHAIQGIVVTAGSIGILIFFLVRDRFAQRRYSFGYLVVFTAVGILAILGTLQRGPLTFLYKRSVSLRGSYWHAGLEMGNSNPITGVGMDSYGDWYRRTRPAIALVDMPGVNTTSNVAHNVLIDFFASGGYPLLFCYLGTLILGVRAIVKFTLRNPNFDPKFVAMVVVWLGYQAQSTISINQIGLAIWGWLFTGLLISYEYTSRNSEDVEKARYNKLNVIKRQTNAVVSPQLIAGIGVVIGTFVASPPFMADVKWFNAMNSQSVVNIEAAMKPSFMNPSDSMKYLQTIDVFQNNDLLDQAHKYALNSVTFNPDYFDAWRQLYLLPNSSELEKNLALENMKRLDPLNPDVTEFQ